MISPQSYVPIPTPVQAVQVTAENAAEVSKVFGGWPKFWESYIGWWAVTDDEDGRRCISDDEFRRRYQPAEEGS